MRKSCGMRHYLDHAATTPLRAEARDAWLAATEVVGNASSTHGAGQDARRMLEDARERVAAVLGADPIEVVFTSGGTESINLALQGLWAARADGADAVVLPDAEHHATMDTVASLLSAGAVVRDVPVSADGSIERDAFRGALPGAALATALVANNEVGTVNDAAGLAADAAAASVPLHLDAVAALGHLPLSFRGLRGPAPAGAGLVALSAAGHKIGAPVGVGSTRRRPHRASACADARRRPAARVARGDAGHRRRRCVRHRPGTRRGRARRRIRSAALVARAPRRRHPHPRARSDASRRPPSTGCLGTLTCCSPVRWGRACCSCSTSPASRCPPDPPVRRESPNRRMS
ncbi:hypothetical protein HA402_010404 [Bradysia odoriphaga]|nr:hypothetical protein HA402_010404 [Bradysia odoriphaga]